MEMNDIKIFQTGRLCAAKSSLLPSTVCCKQKAFSFLLMNSWTKNFLGFFDAFSVVKDELWMTALAP